MLGPSANSKSIANKRLKLKIAVGRRAFGRLPLALAS